MSQSPSHTKLWLICFTLIFLFTIFLDILSGHFLISRSRGAHRRYHYYYHHDFIPRSQAVENWGKDYRVFTNSLGFKDKAARAVPLSSKNRRILLMGDSFTEGVGEPYENTFAGFLDSILSLRGIEVLNAGVEGYGTKNYLAKTQFLLENTGLKFDEMLLFIDLSDPVNAVYNDIIFPQDDIFKNRRLSYRTNEYLKKISFLAFSLNKIISRHEEALRKKVVLSAFPGEKLPENMTQWTIHPDIYDKWVRKGLESCIRDIDQLFQLCRSSGIELRIAVYPHPFQIQHRDENSIHLKTWESFCRERNIRFINLYPVFMDSWLPYSRIYETYFIKGDFHWNRNGHLAVAREVEKHIPVRSSSPVE